jgi:hypothetical protein
MQQEAMWMLRLHFCSETGKIKCNACNEPPKQRCTTECNLIYRKSRRLNDTVCNATVFPVHIRLILVLTSPPLQLFIPADRRCDQSDCILANASCMCSGIKLALASSGSRKSELAGNVYSSSPSSSRLRFSGGPPLLLAFLLLPTGALL